MGMQLPQKYRPMKYGEIVGQPIAVRFLQSLSRKNLGRNIIFHGSYGAGKTTSARIYAKSLNCFQISPEGDPCYCCEACRDDSTTLEIDAASTSGKEDVKALLEVSRTPPITGKYRVVILDEAQQFSKAAWDALLKSIEEPKPWQVFLFSTTELDKVRNEIKSRCQCLEIKVLNPETSRNYLKKVCGVESFTYEELALDIISFMSRGHARDLLKNLEQVSFLGDITVENTKVIFNLGFLTPLMKIVSALLNPSTTKFRHEISAFEESSRNVLEYLRQFHLQLYYKFLCASTTEINPAFSLIPPLDLQNLWNRYEPLLGNPPGDSLQKIMIELAEIKDFSPVTLEIGLLKLHRFIHVQKICGDISSQQTTPSVSTVVNKTMQKKGRQFVTMGAQAKTESVATPSVPTPVPATAPIPASVSKLNSPVSCHDLSQKGFIPYDIKTELDLIYKEEI